jgi:Restriction endonuclease XhoI
MDSLSGRRVGEAPRPFVGWLMLVEDAPESRSPVKETSPRFATFPEFRGASYLERCNILCRKLTQERLYTTATLMASPRTAAATGEFANLSEMTSLKTFITSFAGHIVSALPELVPVV